MNSNNNSTSSDSQQKETSAARKPGKIRSQEYRKRKKVFMEELQSKYDILYAENVQLREENKSLKEVRHATLP